MSDTLSFFLCVLTMQSIKEQHPSTSLYWVYLSTILNVYA